ncbi:hypothetical protein BN14_06053 [Rhizoctonia solani AG-1 IB]|uniref:Uncharacterized protein n=1 Tax=Thanatephorus cucumeris (strain AG1-IB / isolate 7/3/14) TaxID=1108050 RepID=M5BXU3_THACB|nr:hypothetical protein BN14_06053 [Rhizoctonia solani AG-1 IB]
MKQTRAEREEDEERAYRKAQKAARKARRLYPEHEASSSSKHKRKRSRSPSRRHEKRHRSIPPFDDYSKEDTQAPPASTSNIDMDKLRAEMEERAFREKLFDAMGDDFGMENTEAHFNEYDDSVPERWKHPASSHLRDDPSIMDDDQYAEWIREGMWRRTHKAEVEAQERAEEERKRKKEREKARREDTRRMEREDNERKSKRRQAKEQQSVVEGWIAYEARWAQMRPSETTSFGFVDLPWPCHPPPRLPLDPDALSKQTISAFLLSPLHSIGKPRKQRLREALLLYHPDRFVAKWMGRVKKEDAQVVHDGVGRVTRVLTGLVEEGDQGE